MDVKQAITNIIAAHKAIPLSNAPVDVVVVGEILSERSESMKVFNAGNGLRRAIILPSYRTDDGKIIGTPFHWKDTDGSFKSIDPTVKRKPLLDPLQTHQYETKSGLYHAHFKADKPWDYRLEVGDRWVEYEALFAESESLSIDVQTSRIGVKETITLLDEKAPTKFDWKFTRSDEWDYSITLPTPTAVDAKGKEVSVTLNMEDGDIHISLDVTDVVFPITLDPTSVIATNDGQIYNRDNVYLTERNGVTGYAVVTTNWGVGQSVPSYYVTRRSFGSFASLPNMGAVTAASLFLDGNTDASDTDFEIYILVSSCSNPLVIEDFDQFAGWQASGAYNGTVLNNVWDSGVNYSADWNEIVFNAAGLAAILAKSNNTFLMVAISKEDYNASPPTGNEHILFESSATSGKEPYLSITFTLIVAPTVTTQAATSVEATTATGNGNITATGGENASAKGICCCLASHSETPDTGDTIFAGSGSGGQGAFTASATSLTAGTAYHFRAYATNSAGTSYGATVDVLTKPAAPTNVAATENNSTKVIITWTKSTGATDYHVWRGAVDLGAAGDVATFDDTGAAAPLITAGASVASDGTSTAQINLSLNGTSVANGTTHTYKVVASNATGNSADSATDTGYRLATALTYQWNRSSGDADSGYSTIVGATSSTYADTAAPAPTITPGTASASDGTSTDYVTLGVTGESANIGAGRYYTCTLVSTGASNTPATSTANRGYRGVGSLTYQWKRSDADSDADYNTNLGTTDPYNDTTAPVGAVGRYYKCVMDATGSAQATSTADRGYRAQVYRNMAGEADIVLTASSGLYADRAMSGQADIVLGALISLYADRAMSGQANIILDTLLIPSKFAFMSSQANIVLNALVEMTRNRNMSGQADIALDAVIEIYANRNMSGQSAIVLDSLINMYADRNMTGQVDISLDSLMGMYADRMMNGQSDIVLDSSLLLSRIFETSNQANIILDSSLLLSRIFETSSQANIVLDAIMEIYSDRNMGGQASIVLDALMNVYADRNMTGQVNIVLDTLMSLYADRNMSAQANVILDAALLLSRIFETSSQANIVLDTLMTIYADKNMSGQADIVLDAFMTMYADRNMTGQSNIVLDTLMTMYADRYMTGQADIVLDTLLLLYADRFSATQVDIDLSTYLFMGIDGNTGLVTRY